MPETAIEPCKGRRDTVVVGTFAFKAGDGRRALHGRRPPHDQFPVLTGLREQDRRRLLLDGSGTIAELSQNLNAPRAVPRSDVRYPSALSAAVADAYRGRHTASLDVGGLISPCRSSRARGHRPRHRLRSARAGRPGRRGLQ